jgi:hypothetical protein
LAQPSSAISPASPLTIVARRYHHSQAVFRGVGKSEPAHHREVHDFGRHPALAEIDHIGVRAGGGQHRAGRRHDRQANEGALRLEAAQHLADGGGRLGAALAHVEMRVGPVADEHVG